MSPLVIISNMKHFFIAAFLILGSVSSLYSQIDELPPVFKIGDHEKDYEKLVTQCNTMLLTVCKNNMEKAYSSWTNMLGDMENYAEEIDFDLKGIKIWINVFWDENGSVEHIVYYPKPNSKNMNFDELTAFLKLFMNEYTFDQKSSRCYSHYGSASFPTFASIYNTNEK